MKTCKNCQKEKPFSEFYSNGRTPKGTKKYKPNCKSCTVSIQYDQFIEKVLDALDSLGRAFACEHCGYCEHPAALQFHHTGNEKNEELSNMKTASLARITKEIELCEVLCANCHSIEHWKESRS